MRLDNIQTDLFGLAVVIVAVVGVIVLSEDREEKPVADVASVSVPMTVLEAGTPCELTVATEALPFLEQIGLRKSLAMCMEQGGWR